MLKIRTSSVAQDWKQRWQLYCPSYCSIILYVSHLFYSYIHIYTEGTINFENCKSVMLLHSLDFSIVLLDFQVKGKKSVKHKNHSSPLPITKHFPVIWISHTAYLSTYKSHNLNYCPWQFLNSIMLFNESVLQHVMQILTIAVNISSFYCTKIYLLH